MAVNSSTLLRHAMIIFVQKLTQVIKSNTVGFLGIGTETQKENTKNTKKTTEINWD